MQRNAQGQFLIIQNTFLVACEEIRLEIQKYKKTDAKHKNRGRAGLRQCRIWRFLFLSGSKKRLLAIILAPTFSLSKII